MEDLQRADASIQRVQELLSTPSAIPEGEAGALLPEGAIAVRFDQVSFAYEAELERATLQEINFELPAGHVLGLLGRTGSGKTTLARLLMRFYDVTDGVIELGGMDIRRPYLKQLRSRVGYVTQNIEIFEGTVRDNLTFYDEEISDSKVVDTLRDIGLGSWLAVLPHGLDTRLESGGGGLSAGEGQLLAFARVFLSDPGLVILDEASSRLDPATEQLIEQAINRLLQGRSCIIIAHRLSTIERADLIMILEDGRLVEYGERKILASNPDSRFAQVLAAGKEEVFA